MNTTYPASDLDRIERLMMLLGSHWQLTYQGNFSVEQFMRGVALEEGQIEQDLSETVDVLSRVTVPLWHVDNWYRLVISESALASRILLYGEDGLYNDGIHQYGVPPMRFTHSFPKPAGLTRTPAIASGIETASRAFIHGVDFELDDDYIVFRENPFNDSTLTIENAYTDGEITDRTIELWAYRGSFDREYIYKHFGYMLGLKLASGQSYRDLVNLVLDAYAKGASRSAVEQLVAVVTGTPIVKATGEVVEVIVKDSRGLVIATDQEAYRFSSEANAIVAVGDVLVAGQQLVDAVRIDELGSGVIPEGLTALAIGAGILSSEFDGELGFVDDDVALTSSTDNEGITRVEFNLLGFPSEVEEFWDSVHARGKASGATTLATCLDLRAKPLPSPTQPFHLPPTINPLQFLVSNVLRGATLIRVKADRILGALSSNELRWLNRIIPPWTTVIVMFELELGNDAVIMDSPGGDPGYSEAAPGQWDTADITGDSITAGVSVSEDPTLYLIDGYCL